jgi:hypothetical protein
MAMFIFVMNNRPRQALKLIALSLSLAMGACGPVDDTEEVDEPLTLEPAMECAPAPEGADQEAVAAYERVNAYRKAAGLGCITFSKEIASAAEDHCEYVTSSKGMCTASPHREVEGCEGFRGEKFSARLKAASYQGQSAYEAMTYVGKGSKAVDMWVDSVWHRIPILSPWIGDAGYGRSGRCDTMDFAWSKTPDKSTPPVMYPFNGQVGVRRSWDGKTEAPALPEPPRGWPSGYPIMLYMAGLKVDSHVLYDEDGEKVEHTFLAPGDKASLGILLNEFAMYAHKPLTKKTTYLVVIDGKRGSEPVHVEWSFTTK